MPGAELLTGVYAAIIGLTLIVLFLGLLVAGLLRSHAAILRQLDSIGAGLGDSSEEEHSQRLSLQAKPWSEGAPLLVGTDPGGEPIAISPDVGKDPLLIAFLSTSCSSCTLFWEGLDQATMEFGGNPHRLVVATLGPEEESPTRAGSLSRGDVAVVMSSQAWADYGVPGAPYFAVVEPGKGIIGEGSADNFEALATFLGDAANDRRWDQTGRDEFGADRASRIDRELREAGIEPGDPRLHHQPGDIDG
jgi:hypothetical protein